MKNEKIEISRDVEFKENKKWDWKQQEEVKKTSKLSIWKTLHSLRNKLKVLSNPVFIQTNDHDTSDEDGEAFEPPKKVKSMTEILEKAPIIMVEEAAQAIEDFFHVNEEPYTYDEACGNKE